MVTRVLECVDHHNVAIKRLGAIESPLMIIILQTQSGHLHVAEAIFLGVPLFDGMALESVNYCASPGAGADSNKGNSPQM